MRKKKDGSQGTRYNSLADVLKALSEQNAQRQIKEDLAKAEIEKSTGKRIPPPRCQYHEKEEMPSFWGFYNLFAYDLARPFGLLITATYAFILTILALAAGIGDITPTLHYSIFLGTVILMTCLSLVIIPSIARTCWFKYKFQQLQFRITGLQNLLTYLGDNEKYVLCNISLYMRDIVWQDDGYVSKNDPATRNVGDAILKRLRLEGNKYFSKVLRELGDWNEWALDPKDPRSQGASTNSVTGYVNNRLTGKIIRLLTRDISRLQNSCGLIDEFHFRVVEES